MNEKTNYEYPQDKLFECREQIKIKSFFFIKYLIKITSKKFNSNIISFYFRIPDFSIKFNLENNSLYKIIKKFNIKDLYNLIVNINDFNNLITLLNQESDSVIIYISYTINNRHKF